MLGCFSGGQDSAFLLKICSLVLPFDKILAVTAVSATYPAVEIAKAIGAACSTIRNILIWQGGKKKEKD